MVDGLLSCPALTFIQALREESIFQSFWSGQRLEAATLASASLLGPHARSDSVEAKDVITSFCALLAKSLRSSVPSSDLPDCALPYSVFPINISASESGAAEARNVVKSNILLAPSFPDSYLCLFLLSCACQLNESELSWCVQRYLSILSRMFPRRRDLIYHLFSCQEVRHLEPLGGWPMLKEAELYSSYDVVVQMLQRMWNKGCTAPLFLAYASCFLLPNPIPESDFPLRIYTVLGEGGRLSYLFRSIYQRYHSVARASFLSNLIFDLFGQEKLDQVLLDSVLVDLRRHSVSVASADAASECDSPCRDSLNNLRSYSVHEKPLLAIISPDLRNHPVGRFWLPIVRQLRNSYRIAHVLLCPLGFMGDATSSALRALSESWTQISSADLKGLVDHLKNINPAVAIDLAGHTADSQALWLYQRIAPVQCSYLGFYGPTYATHSDWWITDRFLSKYIQNSYPGSEPQWSLPVSSLCYNIEDHGLHCPSLALMSASRHGVFGSFNHTRKLTPTTLEYYGTILASHPSATLCIRSHSFAEPEVGRWFIQKLVDSGVQPSQLLMLPFAPTPAEAMMDFNRIQIHLDTYPVSGTTTTLDSLSMGVPVLTCPTSLYAGSISAAILDSLGLSECVAEDQSELSSKASWLLQAYRSPTERLALANRIRTSDSCNPLILSTAFANAMRDMLKHVSR